MQFKTEQEAFWHGQFGDDYVDRSQDPRSIAANYSLFSHILGYARDVDTALELGPNVGLNLVALRGLLPACELTAVEINDKAAALARNAVPSAEIIQQSLLDFEPKRQWRLVFTKGVLIHIDPSQLPRVYRSMHAASSRYILVAEYYSPKPIEVVYRGHTGKLFKRDFAGELLDLFDDLMLAGYGFAYHRDRCFPQDDLNWFLLEKR